MRSRFFIPLRSQLLVALAAATVLFAHQALFAATPPDAPIFKRVVVVGASASAGYTILRGPGAPTGDQLRLSRYVDAALLSPHEPVKSVADLLMFLAPERSGQREISNAVAMQPSLIVGVDFLFWFCYGELGANETRTARLESGLKLLESVTCPIVIGNIPDASGADKDMLSPEAIPTRAEMDAANRRIKEWAAKHKNVVVFDLAKDMAQAASDRALTVHGNKWPAGNTRALLQDDGLHPMPAGCSMLTVAALDALCAADQKVPKKAVGWDAETIRKAALAASAAQPKPWQGFTTSAPRPL